MAKLRVRMLRIGKLHFRACSSQMEYVPDLRLAVVVALLSLSCSEPVATDPRDLAGSYSATTFESVAAERVEDHLRAGGHLLVEIRPEGTFNASILIPAESVAMAVSGMWTSTNGNVQFNTETDTFLRDLSFQIDGAGRLVGERQFGSVKVRVTLAKAGSGVALLLTRWAASAL